MARMGLRGLVPVLGWGAATLASIGLATVALQPVLRAAATEPVPAAPPAAAAHAADPPAPPATSSVAPPAGTDSSAQEAPPRTTPPTGGPAAITPPATPAAPPATVVDGWTVTTGADGEPTYTRTFRVDGGVAVIRMTPGEVELVSATPSPGYTADVFQSEPGNLAVQFTASARYTVIHTIWQDGPVALVSDSSG